MSLWEQRFGYPVPERSEDGQRLYPDEMMTALHDALDDELSIASAIAKARRTQLRPRREPVGFTGRSEPPEEAR